MATSTPQHNAFELLRTSIDDVLNAAYKREKSLEAFVEELKTSGITANQFDLVIQGGYFHAGQPTYVGTQLMLGTVELYASLPASEKAQLREHYFDRLNALKTELPELCAKFEKQLR